MEFQGIGHFAYDKLVHVERPKNSDYEMISQIYSCNCVTAIGEGKFFVSFFGMVEMYEGVIDLSSSEFEEIKEIDYIWVNIDNSDYFETNWQTFTVVAIYANGKLYSKLSRKQVFLDESAACLRDEEGKRLCLALDKRDNINFEAQSLDPPDEIGHYELLHDYVQDLWESFMKENSDVPFETFSIKPITFKNLSTKLEESGKLQTISAEIDGAPHVFAKTFVLDIKLSHNTWIEGQENPALIKSKDTWYVVIQADDDSSRKLYRLTKMN
jgi:hypothetical protein